MFGKNQFSKWEIAGMAVAVLLMAVALFGFRLQNSNLAMIDPSAIGGRNQQAAGLQAVFVSENSPNKTASRESALRESVTSKGVLSKLVIDDITLGTGSKEVKKGNTVVVNYIGTLEDGTEFDNSYKKGEAFTFKAGAGKVIEGWDQGIIGMKEGGKRVLVIPYEQAYGKKGYGNIPPKANLVFLIELLEIK